MEYNDAELITLVKENNEDIKDFIYDKYNYIIDVIMKKYTKPFYALNMDLTEVRQEALLAFSDAISRYTAEKDTSLPTFITIVVERKIQKCIRRADTNKNRKNQTNYSLDYEYEVFTKPLNELLGDVNADPLIKTISKERYDELILNIEKSLSPFEYEVYKLLINEFDYQQIAQILDKEAKQIDNTIQRIRSKIKEFL